MNVEFCLVALRVTYVLCFSRLLKVYKINFYIHMQICLKFTFSSGKKNQHFLNHVARFVQ